MLIGSVAPVIDLGWQGVHLREIYFYITMSFVSIYLLMNKI